ncbi:hypothetical protein L1987_58206 [Smallanthus sonchifolius]|uniref:Uncharacterized protein n=1 Tax=Smallanthus sonchifolius TaxID=185202 RepID=A0ACB9DEK0_9ASTR|nr:hypothetical protein L1987_58206 [Smallanthus sonchifolius]
MVGLDNRCNGLEGGVWWCTTETQGVGRGDSHGRDSQTQRLVLSKSLSVYSRGRGSALNVEVSRSFVNPISIILTDQGVSESITPIPTESSYTVHNDDVQHDSMSSSSIEDAPD